VIDTPIEKWGSRTRRQYFTTCALEGRWNATAHNECRIHRTFVRGCPCSLHLCSRSCTASCEYESRMSSRVSACDPSRASRWNSGLAELMVVVRASVSSRLLEPAFLAVSVASFRYIAGRSFGLIWTDLFWSRVPPSARSSNALRLYVRSQSWKLLQSLTAITATTRSNPLSFFAIIRRVILEPVAKFCGSSAARFSLIAAD